MSEQSLPQIVPITNPRVKDITGQRFGRLVALGYVGTKEIGLNQKRAQWLCRCDCGSVIVAVGAHLRQQHTTSCGCYNIDVTRQSAQNKETHGMTGTPEYRAWQSMHQRCYNPQCNSYQWYGKRGIEVCERWRTFENFLADLGNRPTPDHSLDRIDNDGDYDPGNCRWATDIEQKNNKRTNKVISYCGEEHSLAEWSRITGISYTLLKARINTYKWPIERALSEPVNKKARPSD